MDSILREKKGQSWKNIECINCKSSIEPASAVKSLISFLTFFFKMSKRYYKFTMVLWGMPGQTHQI